MSQEVIFGFPEEWQPFVDRNSRFFERVANLFKAIDKAFHIQSAQATPLQQFVFLHARICIEDFFEVLQCCGNGYGIAGMKLLRGLYEKAVTLEYLGEHPEDLDDYFAYRHIANFKLFTAARQTLGSEAVSDHLLAEATAEYNKVRERFSIIACRECGSERLNHTWNKLDIVSMAMKTRILGTLIVPAYYMALRHAHSTAGALAERVYLDRDHFGFDPEPQRRQADDALRLSFLIAIEVLVVFERTFKSSELGVLVDGLAEDYVYAYVSAAQDN